MKGKGIITRLVFLVSMVSLFTDVASEMLYPIMPVYLRSIGFSVILIGVLEGLAEATAGLSKGYFGQLSDRLGRRAPFIRWGYGMSALSKPLMAAFTFPWWIFLARTMDRLGKGVRTSARDALLSEEATPATKGKVFGFHRSMDTLGAAIGPMLALLFLYLYPGHYRMMFIIAVVPGLAAVCLTLLLRDKKVPAETKGRSPGFFSYFLYWKRSSRMYKQLLAGLLVFTLFNSSDAFLLLCTREKLGSDSMMIGFYVYYNMVYALASYPLGALGDKAGLRSVLILGLTMFSGVYFFFGLATSFLHFGLLFLLYGLYAASTEGISKALISNLAHPSETATAIGLFNSLSSIFALMASSLAGFLWYTFSPGTMFMVSGIGVGLVVVYLITLVIYNKPSKTRLSTL
ncbi:MAG: MFS transporter [Bacteroidetes bacterium]|nr:MFS transporter [Bacteroidota bacterium]